MRSKWRLKSNIKKSAVVVFSKVAITDMCAWKWGDKVIPRVVSYCSRRLLLVSPLPL